METENFWEKFLKWVIWIVLSALLLTALYFLLKNFTSIW